MELLGARIRLNPRPPRRHKAALEVAMLGHCPGQVRISRLLRHDESLEEMRHVGFGEVVDALLSGTADETGVGALYHVPVPLQSSAEFHDIFPDTQELGTEYTSILAGDRAWLPQAVEDFFANGGEKLWVVRIPESENQAGFLPTPETVLHDVRTLHGLATVLILPEVGLVSFPDLERLQIPSELPDVPRLRLENPDPQFLPCTSRYDDTHRERRHPDEIPDVVPPWPILKILQVLQNTLRHARPDMQCLFTLPVTYSGEAGSPAIDPMALQDIEAMKMGNDGPGLRRIQLLFPYLRSRRHRLVSPAGLVAGLQAGVASQLGVWRSVAGRPMLTDSKPYPRITTHQAVQLRETPGVGVIQYRNAMVSLDDERLAVPALHRADWANAVDPDRFDGYRSGEVARFLGYLIRQLQNLGESLVFDIDFRDPRPRLLLEQLFQNLYSLGALRGRKPEDAFAIRVNHPKEGAMVYEIEVAPAFPIDKMHLTFANSRGQWQVGVSGV